jgi:MFS family permease
VFKTAAARHGSLPAVAMLVVLLAGQALASMDGSIMAVAAPSLHADLHASGAVVQLVIAAYLIAFAALVVIGARLGDLIGRRRAFVAGLSGFALCSLVGGLAPDPGVLVLARLAQGGAGALMTPQVLALIQVHFTGEARARAIGAYSLILAVGVAAGQIIGGLLISAHLLAGAWRPALLLNAPAGAILLLIGRRALPHTPPGPPQRLDLGGAGLLAAALLGLVVPLTLGRQAGWPSWVWPCLTAGAIAAAAFVVQERRVGERGAQPLFELAVLGWPGVAAGALAVTVLMGAYAGFLLSLTLRLQDGLGFTAVHAGLVFALYASGFATASLTWPRLGDTLRARLPLAGPLVMGAALVGVGVLTDRPRWPALAAAPLLYLAGAGHACGYSPLANRLTGLVDARRVTELSALLMIAALVGQIVGVAGLAGVYLGAAGQGSGGALVLTTALAAGALALAALAAGRALGARTLSIADSS